MAGKGGHGQQDIVILALATGKTQADAARDSGASVRTISRWLQTDTFRQRVDDINNEQTYSLVKRYMRRPAEELYDTAKDPYEMHNLATAPHHAKRKASLSAELDRWMSKQGDPGVKQDTFKVLKAARSGNHLCGPPVSK